MDTASYALSIEGPASRDVYKRRQVEAARLRVLGRRKSHAWPEAGAGDAKSFESTCKSEG
jgi:hypothetical protein